MLALAAAAAIVPVLARADGSHKVQPGETLWSLSQTYGVGLQTLAAANGISNINFVVAGTVLTIPAGSSSGGGQSAAASTYVVQPGDTLWRISRMFGVSLDQLVAANGLANPHLVVVGTRLSVPGGSSSPSTSSTPTAVAVLLDGAAHSAGIDNTLVRALAWQESGWQQHVVSSAGAVGVMQLLPGTADWVSQHLVGENLNYWQVGDNVRGGVALLTHLLNLSGWHVPTALGAYYQGWHSVQTQGISNDTWNYINNILEIQTWYW
jgi:LysM repeat protein